MSKKEETEVEPGSLNPDVPEVDPDIPETDTEDSEDNDDIDIHDPLEVVMSLNHVKELIDFLRPRGYNSLADAFLAVEAGEYITINVEL